MARFDGFACFIDMKRHAVEFLQQVVGKFDISFVNLINEQDDFFVTLKGLPNLAFLDIVRDIAHPFIAQLTVAQPADRIIFIKPLACLSSG